MTRQGAKAAKDAGEEAKVTPNRMRAGFVGDPNELQLPESTGYLCDANVRE